MYCIVLYLSPVLNPMSYDGARLYKAPSRPMLVIGRRYLIIYIDDWYSRMVWGYMLETKSADEICVFFKQFKAMVENEKPGYRIQRLRCE